MRRGGLLTHTHPPRPTVMQRVTLELTGSYPSQAKVIVLMVSFWTSSSQEVPLEELPLSQKIPQSR